MNAAKGDKAHELVSHVAHKVDGWSEEPLTSVVYETKEDGKVAVLTMSRPGARNAWTEIMRNEMCRCLDTASKDPKVRAVVITGDPKGNAFCAGADLGAASKDNPSSILGDVPPGRDPNIQYWRDGGGTAGLAIMRSTKPVIAAINGAAVGVGMTLPLCCDMTVAAEDARVGFVFGRRGLTMECLSSYFLERCVGHKKAMELVLTGRIFQAKEAPMGLFNYTVPQAECLPKAMALAVECAETSGMSNMLNRNLIIRNGHSTSPELAHLIESRSIYWVSRQADVKEGISSFLEKRPASWKLDPFQDSPDFFPWWWETETRAKL